jgi:hypothetical protein
MEALWRNWEVRTRLKKEKRSRGRANFYCRATALVERQNESPCANHQKLGLHVIEACPANLLRVVHLVLIHTQGILQRFTIYFYEATGRSVLWTPLAKQIIPLFEAPKTNNLIGGSSFVAVHLELPAASPVILIIAFFSLFVSQNSLLCL